MVNGCIHVEKGAFVEWSQQSVNSELHSPFHHECCLEDRGVEPQSRRNQTEFRSVNSRR